MCLLLQAGLDLGFPAPVLVLEVQQGIAPRIFRYAGAFSTPVTPSRSVVTGGRNSGRFALAVLYPLALRVRNAYAAVSIRTWVDDLAQRTMGARAKLAAGSLARSR